MSIIVDAENTGETKSKKQVHRQLENLDASLKSLATLVSSLGIEMVSVLNAVPVDGGKGDEKAEELLTPLANDIRKLRERCDQIRQNVESMRQRLEV